MATDHHRLTMTRRLIEIPLLLQQREHSHQELIALYEVDSVTIRRDMRALAEFWPIERLTRGRQLFYRLAPDAKPTTRYENQTT